MTARAVVLSDSLFVAYDSNTKSPYFAEDGWAFLFTQEKFADDWLDFMFRRLRTSLVVKRVPKERAGGFVHDLIAFRGAKSLMIDDGATDWILFDGPAFASFSFVRPNAETKKSS